MLQVIRKKYVAENFIMYIYAIDILKTNLKYCVKRSDTSVHKLTQISLYYDTIVTAETIDRMTRTKWSVIKFLSAAKETIPKFHFAFPFVLPNCKIVFSKKRRRFLRLK